MHLDVLFRSCSRVAAFHGNARPMGIGKTELIVRCLDSIIKSVQQALESGELSGARLTVIDDRSSDECLSLMGMRLSSCAFPTEIITSAVTGNGPSMMSAFAWMRTHGQGLFYLVEDDYLHTRSAIGEMVDAFAAGTRITGSDVVIFPCDYPDRYQAPYESVVLLSGRRYWRTVLHSTGTFLTSRANLERFWPIYERFTHFGVDPNVGEANTVNLIYRQTACLSPMPSLTKHMHEGLDSPFTRWEDWWQETAMPQLPDRQMDLGCTEIQGR